MHKSVTSRRWFGLRRAVGRPAQDDPADLGTAFGLDLSLSQLPDDAARTPPAPLRDRDGWMQRLRARRKPAF
jgi:hypothetical protein